MGADAEVNIYIGSSNENFSQVFNDFAVADGGLITLI